MKKTKKTYHHGNLKIETLQKAVELLSQNGMESLSLREIAKSLSVSHVSVLRHFKTKKDLFFQIAIVGFEELNAKLETCDNLNEFGKTYFEFASENPQKYDLMFHPDLSPKENSELAAVGSKTVALLLNLINKSKSKYNLDPDVVFALSWCFVHGLSSLHLKGVLKMVKPGRPAKNLIDLFSSVIAAN